MTAAFKMKAAVIALIKAPVLDIQNISCQKRLCVRYTTILRINRRTCRRV